MPRALPGSPTLSVGVSVGGGAVSYRAFLEAMAVDAAARRALTDLLREAPFEGFFWECPPLTAATADGDAEFVLVPSGMLARLRADERPFREHLAHAGLVAVFPNLGGDATLVAPTRMSGANYAHLASFVREAPDDQIDAFWRAVGEVALGAIGPDPRWLSTAGLGVSWLHVRLDSRPKYYRHEPYERSPRA